MQHSIEPDKQSSGSRLILGIESSCDETSASVVERGARVLSNVVASQIPTHSPYGGVVPELASREHLRNIVPVVREAIKQAGCTLQDLDAIAVTSGPGLAGALLVGISYAKALSYALNKPLVAVNHLEGHIHAVLLEQRQRSQEGLPLPALAMVVSGGHTHLYLAKQPRNLASEHNQDEASWHYRCVGRTLDDAAGEAFDKVAKLLGLGYPGGPWIDALAVHGDPKAVPFTFAQVKDKVHLHGRTRPSSRGENAVEDRRLLFSFSGIKTAVLRYVETHNLKDSIAARRLALAQILSPTTNDALALCDKETLGLIASFQHAVVGDLLRRSFIAAEAYGVASLIVSGGVAANRELRVRLTAEAAERGIPIAFPTLAMATDNAAMIAAAAWPRYTAGEFAPADLTADPALALGR
jgi:N6-L-threonylcarbamoyladenine synthase